MVRGLTIKPPQMSMIPQYSVNADLHIMSNGHLIILKNYTWSKVQKRQK